MMLRRFVSCLLFSLCALLGACAVHRPDDAYDPTVQPDGNSDIKQQFQKDAGAVKPRPVVTPVRDGGSTRPPVTVPSETDAQVGVGPATPSPLEALTGYYLMRMDMYSRWETSKPLLTVVRNRISNLMFVSVELENGKLVASEKICDQTYQHVCEKGCITWETKLHPEMLDKFDQAASVEREYTYDAATRELRGGKATLSLGFDDNDGKTALPTDPSDARVWKLTVGSGVYTLLSATASVGTLRQELACSVSSVQRFATTFAGKLDKLALEGDLKLDAPGEARDIAIAGGARCTRDTVDNSDLENTEQWVRFKKVSTAECPSDFEAAFPSKGP